MSRRINGSLWIGLLLSVVAFVSYFAVFARFPITRDMPWATLLLFAVALVLLFRGARQRTITSYLVTTLGVAIAVFFCFAVFVATKWLPASQHAPAIGQKVPDFTLFDTNHRAVTLSRMLAAPGAKGVVLVFYRGFW
jgi:hypothetical protein